MKQNIKAAMAMEKVYRKLQNNWKAKTAFGYHDKLKQFGFADTVEYERAKDEYYLKNSGIPVEFVNIRNLATERAKAIAEGREVMHLITADETFVYAGDNCVDCDRHYIAQNGLFVFDYPGASAIVATQYDLALGLLTKRLSLFPLVMERLSQSLRELGLDCYVEKNDILVAGKKIVGGGSYVQDGMLVCGIQISFVVDREKITAICHKPQVKIPMGITEFQAVKRDDLIAKVASWLL